MNKEYLKAETIYCRDKDGDHKIHLKAITDDDILFLRNAENMNAVRAPKHDKTYISYWIFMETPLRDIIHLLKPLQNKEAELKQMGYVRSGKIFHWIQDNPEEKMGGEIEICKMFFRKK